MTRTSRITLAILLASVAGCRGPRSPDGPGLETGDPCEQTAPSVVHGQWCTVDVDGRKREYLLDVPAAAKPGALALVVSFHGIGGAPGPLREYTGLGDAAHERGFLAVHPAGQTVRLGVKVGPGWIIEPGVNREVRFFQEMIRHLSSSYCIDRERIHVMGFSNGAHLCHVLACQEPDGIASFAAVGGGLREMASHCPATSTCSGLVLHGSDDTIVEVEEGREARDFWIDRNGCTSSRDVGDGCTLHDGCVSEDEVLYCEVEGMGHEWPPEATDVALDFFGIRSQSMDAM